MQRTYKTSRRTFLVASTLGCAGWQFGRPALGATTEAVAAEAGRASGKAKSTILFFLCGGSSHIDTFDLKPKAPLEYRGPFNPIATTARDIQLCEHLPLLAKQAHHLALIRSVGGSVSTNDHHAGYYYNLTGHEADPTFLSLGNNRTPYADDWPFMGTVVAAKRPPHAYLANAITLPHKPSKAPYTRPGQFAAKLGVEYDPLYLEGSLEQPLKFSAPSLELQQGMTGGRVASRRELLSAIDDARRAFDANVRTETWTKQQERAFTLLASSRTSAAFDISQEPEALRERYGQNVNGMSLLLARRLVEAEVPFITVFWKEDENRLA